MPRAFGEMFGMEDMARVWPIVVQFGVGAILCAVGIWAGVTSGFLDWKLPQDRRAVGIIVAGFAGLLVLACIFTFWLPNVGNEAAP